MKIRSGLAVSATLLMSSIAAGSPYEQFMLRFDDARTFRHLQIGCYGTASYSWAGPTIQTLRHHREGLLRHAEDTAEFDALERLWVWSTTETSPGNVVVMDLRTGDETTFEAPGLPDKAFVYCVCRQRDLPDCDRSGMLGPLRQRESIRVRANAGG